MKIKSFLERKENVKKKLIKQMNVNSDLIRKIGIKFSALDCRRLTPDRKDFRADAPQKTQNVLEELEHSTERHFASSGLPLKMTRRSRTHKNMYDEDLGARSKGRGQSDPRSQGNGQSYNAAKFSVRSNDSRKQESLDRPSDFEENPFHQLSIPEFNNFNLYNQRPFLKKNSINTPENYESAHKSMTGKKHFEYGTPVTGASDTQWRPSRQQGSFHEEAQSKAESRKDNQVLTKYDLDQLEHKYQPAELTGRQSDSISQFHIRERAHPDSAQGKHKRKDIKGSKRRQKQRSKSRTNWSKQRIQRELEKFEEEMEEEESIVKKVQDIQAPQAAMGQLRRPKRVKRNSIKGMHHVQPPLPNAIRQKKSRTSSRGSIQTNKGHSRRVSSQLEEQKKNSFQKQKMVRSQVRPSYTLRNKEASQSLHHPMERLDILDSVGVTARHPKFEQQKKRYQMRYLQSSRDIAKKPILKQVRQSYEQNYVPEHLEQNMEDWGHPSRMPRRGQYRQMAYKSHKEPNSNMNFDYRNLNANTKAKGNAYMRLPFE